MGTITAEVVDKVHTTAFVLTGFYKYLCIM
jgi:hypothetical protein